MFPTLNNIYKVDPNFSWENPIFTGKMQIPGTKDVESI